MYDDEPIGYDGFDAPLYAHQVSTPRRRAITRSSPPMRVLLGVLVVETLISAGTLVWNVVDAIRHRNDWPTHV